MTKLVVSSGVCGFTTTVSAAMQDDRKTVALTIESSGCEMVSALAADLTSLHKMDVFKGFLQNPVYQAAARHLRHVTCPVPCGVLKAAEAEAGLALPRDVSIVFSAKTGT